MCHRSTHAERSHIGERTHPKFSLNLAPEHKACAGALGNVLRSQGRLDEARPLLEEALQGCRATLGDRHPHTLISLNNMGALLKEMGKLDEARPLLEEAAHLGKAAMGERHPDTLIFAADLDALLK